MKEAHTTEYIAHSMALNLQDLEALIKTFAPLVYFHPDEAHKMTSVDLYLERAYLVDGTSQSKQQALPENLPSSGDHYLELKRPNSAFRENPVSQARTYVNAKAHSALYTDLQFWFFFPFHGNITATITWSVDTIPGHTITALLEPLGKQEGCWQYLTLRIDNKSRGIHQVYLPQPGGGVWLAADQFQRSEKQIMVYVSKNTHFFYPEAGSHFTEAIRLDVHSTVLEFSFKNDTAKGEVLNCSDCYELLSAEFLSENKPAEPPWLNYIGNWGKESMVPSTPNELKLLIKRAFGTKLEFLLNHSVLTDLAEFLYNFFTTEQKTTSKGPKFRSDW